MTDSTASDDDWLIEEDEELPPPAYGGPEQRQWRVLIVDDDVDVHAVTRLALRNVSFKGRELELFSAYSGREGFSLTSSRRSTIEGASWPWPTRKSTAIRWRTWCHRKAEPRTSNQ